MDDTYLGFYQQRLELLETIPTIQESMLQHLNSFISQTIEDSGVSYTSKDGVFSVESKLYRIRINISFDRVIFRITRNRQVKRETNLVSDNKLTNLEGTQVAESALSNVIRSKTSLTLPFSSKTIIWTPNESTFDELLKKHDELNLTFSSQRTKGK